MQMLPRKLLIGPFLALFFTSCDPTSQPSDSSGPSLSDGWRSFELTQFATATKEFEAVAQRSTSGSEERLEALYGRACTEWMLNGGKPSPKAEAWFREVSSLDRSGDLGAWSALAILRMKYSSFDPANLTAAKKECQSVIDAYPERPAATETFILQQAMRIATFEAEETTAVVAAIRQFLQAHPDSPYTPYLYLLLANAFQTLQDPAQQLEAELAALEAPDLVPDRRTLINPVNAGAETYFRVALLAQYRVGDFATAKRLYHKLLTEWPDDVRTFDVRRALKEIDRIEEEIARSGKSDILSKTP